MRIRRPANRGGAVSFASLTMEASSPPPAGSEKPEVLTKYRFVKILDIGKHFSTSGAAVCMATGMTHPLDVIKVRLQLEHVGQRASSTGMRQKLLHMVQNEGPESLYKGLVPALWRSAIYGCLRLGLYEPCKEAFDCALEYSNLFTKLVAGALSGAIATAATNPIDVLKVRMQVPHQPLSGAMVKELQNMVAAEGLAGLWRGVGPSMARASALTASQLATYDESKQAMFCS